MARLLLITTDMYIDSGQYRVTWIPANSLLLLFVVVVVRITFGPKVATGVQEMKVESQKVSPRRVIVKAELYTHTSIKLGPTVPWPHTGGLHHTGWEYKTPVWRLLWDLPMKGLQPSWFRLLSWEVVCSSLPGTWPIKETTLWWRSHVQN